MPVSRGASIKVRGLDELRKRLAGLDLTDELKTAGEYVAELVVDKAEPLMRGQGGMGARAARTLKANRSGKAATVTGGGPGVPFFAGVEFGAIRNVPRRTPRGPVLGWNQFKPWRGSGPDAGYAVYPTIRNSDREIVAVYEREIDRILNPAFPD